MKTTHWIGFVVLCAGCAGAPPLTSLAPVPVQELSVARLQEGMASGKWTSADLTRAYRHRIDTLDRSGPALASVITENAQALKQAAALDEERKAGKVRGPLHGIPVLVKDNVDTADLPTTAGSLALAGSVPAQDAPVVAQLRAAGAVILGKTNLSEWANFRGDHSVSGWSAVGGQTKNPYGQGRNPCGSSSGSGAAIAASLAAVAVGTETDGSIVCPASVNGIVGLKPTVGLVSRTGIIPISVSQDTAGPMARTVTDAAVMLGAMTAVDPQDAATNAAGRKAYTDYTPFLKREALRGARIGVVRDLAGYNAEVDRVLDEAVAVLRKEGAVVIDPVKMPSLPKIDKDELDVLLYEFKDGLNAYLGKLGPGASVHTLAELIAFNQKECEREMPYFRQELFEKAQAKGPLTDKAYKAARAHSFRNAATDGIDAALREHKLDALVAPTVGPAWMTDHANGDHYTGGSSTPAAVAGYPDLSVPAGSVQGLPVGLSFFAGAWSEPKLLGLGFAFEQAAGARRPPELK